MARPDADGQGLRRSGPALDGPGEVALGGPLHDRRQASQQVVPHQGRGRALPSPAAAGGAGRRTIRHDDGRARVVADPAAEMSGSRLGAAVARRAVAGVAAPHRASAAEALARLRHARRPAGRRTSGRSPAVPPRTLGPATEARPRRRTSRHGWPRTVCRSARSIASVSPTSIAELGAASSTDRCWRRPPRAASGSSLAPASKRQSTVGAIAADPWPPRSKTRARRKVARRQPQRRRSVPSGPATMARAIDGDRHPSAWQPDLPGHDGSRLLRGPSPVGGRDAARRDHSTLPIEGWGSDRCHRGRHLLRRARRTQDRAPQRADPAGARRDPARVDRRERVQVARRAVVPHHATGQRPRAVELGPGLAPRAGRHRSGAATRLRLPTRCRHDVAACWRAPRRDRAATRSQRRHPRLHLRRARSTTRSTSETHASSHFSKVGRQSRHDDSRGDCLRSGREEGATNRSVGDRHPLTRDMGDLRVPSQ